jgi:hypothetical protein
MATRAIMIVQFIDSLSSKSTSSFAAIIGNSMQGFRILFRITGIIEPYPFRPLVPV